MLIVLAVVYRLSRQSVQMQLRLMTSTSLLAAQMVLWECLMLRHWTLSLLCRLHTTWELMLQPNSHQRMYSVDVVLLRMILYDTARLFLLFWSRDIELIIDVSHSLWRHNSHKSLSEAHCFWKLLMSFVVTLTLLVSTFHCCYRYYPEKLVE